jgi:hypothetical protein
VQFWRFKPGNRNGRKTCFLLFAVDGGGMDFGGMGLGGTHPSSNPANPFGGSATPNRPATSISAPGGSILKGSALGERPLSSHFGGGGGGSTL